MEIFRDLAKNRGKCVIIVTHSDYVGEYADEILYISDGKIVTSSDSAF